MFGKIQDTSLDRLLVGKVPGQGLVLHSSERVLIPEQDFPPCCGAGSVQVRSLVLIPPPHDLLHLLNAPQSLHSPSTEKTCVFTDIF